MCKYYECSYEKVWLKLKHFMELDPVFMKVLIFLCPLNELYSIIPHVPPIVAASFLKNIICEHKDTDKSKLFPKEIEVSYIFNLFASKISLQEYFSNKWFKSLQHSVTQHFNEEAWWVQLIYVM